MALLFLLTGGTLLMGPPPPGSPKARGAVMLDEDWASRDLVRELPSLGRIADVEARTVLNLDSGDMQPEQWVVLAREIHGALSSGVYEGIVVIHGTDTMAYSASAVAFLLGDLPRPVVFTGAQRPLVEARTDARQNLVDAALVATLRVPEVTIAFGSRALRGVRATKRDAWAFDAFDSPNCPPLVELGVGVDVSPHVRATGDLAGFDGRIEPRVLAVRVFPGIDPSLLLGALGAGVRGLVLEAYGTGNLPHLGGSLIPVLAEAKRAGVPVLIVSQCLRGRVELGRYAGGAEAAEAGAISGGDMTVEAAIAKMMIGLARYPERDALARYLEANVLGERSGGAAGARIGPISP